MLKDFTKEPFDILIQAGQSNAAGHSFGPTDDPYVPDGRVWYLTADFTVIPAAESVDRNEIQSNFGLPFAREYLRRGYLAEGRKLLILRTAAGSTGFLDNHWKPDDPLYRRMTDMTRTALALNETNRLVGLLWHQGENDAARGASFDVHYAHLMELVQSVRAMFGVPELPFVAADFVHHWKNNNLERCIPVTEAMRAVCRDCGHGAFVETDGLLSNIQELDHWPQMWEDTIHFSRRSIYELGKRYFDAYVNLVEK